MRACADRAFAWIERHDHELERGRDGDLVERTWFAKRNGELGMVANFLIGAGDPRGRLLLDRAWARLERGTWLVRNRDVASNAAIYPAFYLHELRNRELETILASTTPRTSSWAVQLLLACSLARCGLASPWSISELLENIHRGRIAGVNLAYLVMHLVWLLQPIGALDARMLDVVRRLLPAWFEEYTRVGYIDLLGEAMITARVLELPVPATASRVLSAAQEDDGMVVFKAAWRGIQGPRWARFEANYHSTFVALAASTMVWQATPTNVFSDDADAIPRAARDRTARLWMSRWSSTRR